MSLPLGMDDELDEERDLLRSVGKAREIPDAFENCPQSYLEATHHPYAPFTGDTIHWNSWVYDDATTCANASAPALPGIGSWSAPAMLCYPRPNTSMHRIRPVRALVRISFHGIGSVAIM